MQEHLAEYRRLVSPLPDDLAVIARYIDAGIPAEILNWQPADELLSRRPHFPLQCPAHAAPGGKTLALAQEVIAGGKTVYTLDHPANAPLRQIGAQVWEQDGMTR